MANAKPAQTQPTCIEHDGTCGRLLHGLGEQRPENALYDKNQRQARPKIAHTREPPPRHCLTGSGSAPGAGAPTRRLRDRRWVRSAASRARPRGH